ncbi:type VII secretion protein EccB [Mycolicibacterium mageritense]
MAGEPATRLQLSGHRFLLRRTAHALVRGDARMVDDPLRAQSISFASGCALAVVAVAAFLVLAFVRPGTALGSAPILISPKSGALYVQIDGVVHPVLNLASARLVTGAAADPQPVGDGALATARRGPLVGIPGAPARIGPPLALDESGWAVCDVADPVGTVLVAGRPHPGFRQLRRGQSLLVVARDEGAANTYLLFDGVRARVDLRDIAAVRALRMEDVAPLSVSRALLDSVPEVAAVRAPSIAAAGTPGPPVLDGLAVGTVIRVVRADGVEFYVVLTTGLQRVGQVAADLIRFTVPQPAGEPPEIAAATVAKVPFVHELPVGTLPERVQAGGAAVRCAGWDPRGSTTKTTLYTADSLSGAAVTVELAQHDGAGPNLDHVSIPAGRSALVRVTGLAGDTLAGSLYLVDDLGVLYGVHDDDAAKRLGLPLPAVPGPWPMLRLLPAGPELSRDGASVVRDGLTAGSAAP